MTFGYDVGPGLRWGEPCAWDDFTQGYTVKPDDSIGDMYVATNGAPYWIASPSACDGNGASISVYCAGNMFSDHLWAVGWQWTTSNSAVLTPVVSVRPTADVRISN